MLRARFFRRPARLGSPLPAIGFLTVVPYASTPADDSHSLARALWAFPFVGLLIGLALFGLDRGARELLPEAAVAALVVLTWTVLTGGLHLDGLADSCDGLFGGRNREDRLRILRDVHHGTWAIVAVVLALLLKFAFLAALAQDVRFGALLLAPLAARGLVVGAMGLWPYARPQGFSGSLHVAARGWPALLGALLALAAGAVAFGPGGPLLVGAAATAGALTAAYATLRLGGLTGDVDGALIEVVEVTTLLAVVVATHNDWLDPWLWDGG